MTSPGSIRHRRLHVVGSWPLEMDPIFSLPKGAAITDLKVKSVGFLEDDNVLATFRLTGFSRGMQFEANPQLKTTLGLNEGPAACCADDTFERRLREMVDIHPTIIVIV